MHSVVVTGGTGFIGHHLVNKLVEKNCQIQIIDNLSNSSSHFVNEFQVNRSKYDNVTIHNVDIRNEASVLNIFRDQTIDTCIHLAAKISVRDSISRPSETIDVNVKGTLNTLEACTKCNVQNFVFASSAAVYGSPRKLPLSEDEMVQPISPYGASKVAGEALVSCYKSKIKNCLSLRFFNIYGKGQTLDYAGVITKFIERLSKGLSPIIYGDGRQTRDFISVNDAVNAIILAGEKDLNPESFLTNTNVFNIGTGKATGILDLALRMIDIFGLESSTQPIYLDPINGDIIHSYANINCAKNLLKFVTKEDLQSGLVNLVECLNFQNGHQT
jgi:UDP-glucose 4-epimerase